jgi:hypothetical protein
MAVYWQHLGWVAQYTTEVSSATTVSFWDQIGLWPSPNWPTVIMAFGVAFLACCASIAVLDIIEARRTGVLPWDCIKRDTPRRRFCAYMGLSACIALGCGLLGAGVALIPLVSIIAAGVAPMAALRGLGGGSLEEVEV